MPLEGSSLGTCSGLRFYDLVGSALVWGDVSCSRESVARGFFSFFVHFCLRSSWKGEWTTENPCLSAAASPRPCFLFRLGQRVKRRRCLNGGGDVGGIPTASPLPPLSGRSGAGAGSGGRRFPPAAKERSPLISLAENKEPAGLLAAPEPGNGRRPVGEGGGGSVRREPPAPCGRVAPASCGGRPSRSPFVRRQPCWEPFLVPALAPPTGRAAGGGVWRAAGALW